MTKRSNNQMTTDPADVATCDHAGAAPRPAPVSEATVAQAARIFQALGDPARLRTLAILAEKELCVSELAAVTGEELSTVSHRLRLLRAEGIVHRRREGRHIHYSLVDEHVVELLRNAFDHAAEG